MLAVKVPPKYAEKEKKKLIGLNMLNRNYKIIREKNHIFFPILKKYVTPFEICNLPGIKRIKQEVSLEGDLTKSEISELRRAFDMVGSIAILDIPPALEHKEKIIGKAFLNKNNIKTVLKKAASHAGTFRTQKMKYLAGENTKKTIHKENGVRILVDVEKVYFSVRLAEERKRIFMQVKKNEDILIMFSGAAPYPVVLSKNTLANSIYGVEINPRGHALGLENLKLNKIKNVHLFCGDVRQVVPKLNKQFDRIIMPLPKTAGDFLDTALKVAKPGCIIHFYNFQPEAEFDKAVQKIKKACKDAKRSCKIIRIRKVGQQSPRIYRICVEFKV